MPTKNCHCLYLCICVKQWSPMSRNYVFKIYDIWMCEDFVVLRCSKCIRSCHAFPGILNLSWDKTAKATAEIIKQAHTIASSITRWSSCNLWIMRYLRKCKCQYGQCQCSKKRSKYKHHANINLHELTFYLFMMWYT